MRSYKTSAAPDDPGVWSDLNNFWPTRRGTYIAADPYHGTGLEGTATGELADTHYYSYAFGTTASSVLWVVGTKIWSGSISGIGAVSLTDRTGGVATGTTSGVMCQYGNQTILATGSGGSELAAGTFSSNFATFATGLKADFIVTQSNCLLAFSTTHASLTNTGGDAWAASDVGDYTNFTPSSSVDAANGRLIQTPGKITGAVAFKNHVYVFKADSIYRGTYVGSPFYWTWEVVKTGIGMAVTGAWAKRAIINCGDFIVFPAYYDASLGIAWYAFDGINYKLLNPDTTVALSSAANQSVCYDDRQKLLFVHGGVASSAADYVYSFETGQWGKSDTVTGVMTIGEKSAYEATIAYGAPTARAVWAATADKFTAKYSTRLATGTTRASYLQTSYIGTPHKKTLFDRVTPILRQKGTSWGNQASAASLEFKTFLELHDTTATVTKTVAEGSVRDRFDIGVADCFGRAKITYTDTLVEVDDFDVRTKPAGTD